MQSYNLYTEKKGKKTVCQTIMETKSWMEQEAELEQQQMQQDEQKRYNDDHEIPNWQWPDEDPTDMIFH